MGVIDDPHAERMLRLPWRLVARALRLPVLRRRGRNASFAYLAARTLFFDEAVRLALDAGIRRVLIVGAGYDSRAWRLHRPGVEFIELDHPDTQADKRDRAPTGGPRYVSLDLATDPIPESLVDAASIIATVEGVSMYLNEDDVVKLLGSLARPGNRLVANFGIGGGTGPRSRQATRNVVAAGGEAFRFEPTRDEVVELLRRTGWEPEQVLTGRDIAVRYLGGTSLPTELTEDAYVITASCGR